MEKVNVISLEPLRVEWLGTVVEANGYYKRGIYAYIIFGSTIKVNGELLKHIMKMDSEVGMSIFLRDSYIFIDDMNLTMLVNKVGFMIAYTILKNYGRGIVLADKPDIYTLVVGASGVGGYYFEEGIGYDYMVSIEKPEHSVARGLGIYHVMQSGALYGINGIVREDEVFKVLYFDVFASNNMLDAFSKTIDLLKRATYYDFSSWIMIPVKTPVFVGNKKFSAKSFFAGLRNFIVNYGDFDAIGLNIAVDDRSVYVSSV